MPCLLAAGWLGLAAAQEPRLLRAYGVFLVLHATWIAAAVALVVAAANAPILGRYAPYILTIKALAVIHAVASGLAFTVLELLRGASAGAAGMATYVLAFVLTWLPVALCVSTAAAARSWFPWGAALVSCTIAATLAVPLSLGVWSLHGLAANIACLASASALSHIYCRKKA